MTIALIAVPAYLLAAFVLSATLVRVAPKAHSSRQIRKHLILFTVLPLLLVVDVLMSIDALRRVMKRGVRGAFEALSGRELFSGDDNAYAYFGYSRRRQNRRRTDRVSRASLARKEAVAKSM